MLATTPLIEALDVPQLAAICRHDMAHLAEPLRVHLPKLLAPLFYAFLMASPTWSRLIDRSLAPFVMVGGVVVYLMFVKWLTAGAHHRETQADRAALQSDSEPAVYARALEVIHRVNWIPARLGRGSRTHPDLYDRMLAAGVQPDFACPAPPSRMLQWLVTLPAALPPVWLVLALLTER